MVASFLFKLSILLLKKISLKTKGMLNSFISKDAKTTIIFAKLTPNANEGMDVSGVIMQKIMSLIREEHGKTGYSYWLNGGNKFNW
jgi:hypothetical protein